MSDLFLDDLIGRPFAQNEKGPDAYDCYGLCQEVYRRLKRHLPDYDYSFVNHSSKDTVTKVAKRIEQERGKYVLLEKPEPYCLVVFCVVPPVVSHIGVVLEDCSKFIHVSRKHAVTVEKLNSYSWKNRIRGYYRWQN